MKKEIKIDSFCYGDTSNHKKCYFCKDNKFCGLWMRNISGVFNPKKKMFKCAFCNPITVTIESEIGPVYNDNVETDSGESRTISF